MEENWLDRFIQARRNQIIRDIEHYLEGFAFRSRPQLEEELYPTIIQAYELCKKGLSQENIRALFNEYTPKDDRFYEILDFVIEEGEAEREASLG